MQTKAIQVIRTNTKSNFPELRLKKTEFLDIKKTQSTIAC